MEQLEVELKPPAPGQGRTADRDDTPPTTPARGDGAEDSGSAAESKEWTDQHAVNLRLSVPLPFFPFYVTIVAGKERRSGQRRKEERRKHPIFTAGNLLVMGYGAAVLAIALGAIAMFATLLIIQRLFEIEIFLR